MLDPHPILFGCFLLVGSIGSVISSQIVSEDNQQEFQRYDEFQTILMDKFDRLEAKVLYQEDEIVSLKEQVKRLESILMDNNKMSRSNGVVNARTAIFTPRTCLAARDSGLPEFKESGNYWIDPDGLGIGDGPIYVYCDMTSGTTLVGHDSEGTVNIPKCSGKGCYKKTIEYRNATLRQMKALADISSDCRQSIEVTCLGGPFTVSSVDYAWWNDVDGIQQNFWSGSDATKHICECGLNNNCVRQDLSCNCDANVAIPLSDNGNVTLKEVLPVTKLNFGRIKYDGASHKLGKFQCSGKSTTSNFPTSCTDLWRIGHSLNGIYPVRAVNFVDFIHCDFSLGQNVRETRIGYVDVKKQPVQFFVQRSKSFSEVNVPILFDIELLNIGLAMNMDDGVFTAPTTGTYLFDFSGVSDPSDGAFSVDFYIDGTKLGSTFADSTGNTQLTVTLPTILQLVKGNKVHLSISKPTGTLFSSPSSPFIHFTGILLEEDIFP